MRINSLGGLLLLCLPLSGLAKAPSAKQRPYVEPDIDAYLQLQRGFKLALVDQDPAGLAQYYDHKRQSGRDRYTAKEALGWGRLFVYPDNDSKLFLQVPHRYHDKWTWEIARQWRDSGKFKAVMVNNVHRYAEQEVDSDYSTAERNPMLAATQVFIKHYWRAGVIQLHGFSEQKRQSTKAKDADIILSHGMALPQQSLKALLAAQACIKQNMDLNALVYPIDVNELGGTRNQVVKAFKRRGRINGFVHVEMSLALRQALVEDPKQSEQLLVCLTGGQ